ncbi:ABC transporter ATP-binding protein [Microbaculum marinum]|uniref:ABC transporter ATP-binding protein n=1 Tax=Microbaculum marinum TaxID=1764581 RepID=A0AAW9RK49_9HYPH
MALLEIENLNAFYGMAQSLHDVSLSVEEGEIVGIIGPNGAGKSTLFDSIMGMTRTTGSIRLNGTELTRMQPAAIVRLGIGYAPERAHLFPYMSVRDNLLVGAYTSRDRIEANLKLVHELFPVLLERRNQETSTQSGGERQMASLGRALMTSPMLLLVDEPTIGLAPKVCLDIAAALRKLNRETGLTIVITEQNVNFAMTLANYLHVLETGEIRTRGTVEELRSDEELNRAYFGQ